MIRSHFRFNQVFFRRLCLALALLLVLQTLPPVAARADSGGMIRVLISRLGTPASITFRTSGTYNVNGAAIASGSTLVAANEGGALTLTSGGSTIARGSSLVINRGGTGTGFGVRFTSPSLANLYCGDLILTPSGEGIRAVLRIYVETYLYGVLPFEMSNSYPIEALKAQAVAARTYAMRARGSGSYDLKDTAASQVYRGYSASYGNAISAVDATRGVCLMSGGGYASCYYTASNGGQTESSRNAWGSAVSYLTVKDDPYDLANPSSTVKSANISKDGAKLSASLTKAISEAAASQLRDAGLTGASIRSVNSAQLHSPRYAEPSRTYTKLKLNVTFEEGGRSASFDVNLATYGGLESALGLSINSENNEIISVTESDEAFTLSFRRWGHGVGLSQRGAQQMAQAHGMGYGEILDFYYPGTSRKTLSLSDVVSTSASPLEPTPSPVPRESEYGYTTLQEGDSGEAVKAMQTRLQELGFFTGTPLGNYKGLTTGAVRAFQEAKGLTVDGVATPYVQKLIFDGEAAATSVPEPTPASGYATLKRGDTGEAVKALQRRLKELGYFSGSIGGNYLTLTETAVQDYQRANGLTADGVATPALQEKIFAAAQPVAASTATPDPTPTPAPTATPEPTPAATPEPTPVGAGRSAVVSLSDSASRLNVRQKATTSSSVVGTLANGERVSVSGTSGAWSAIYTDRLAGYVMTQYLRTAEAGETPAATLVPEPTPASGYATLKRGDTGEAVKALQRRLKELGYFSGSIGGNYLTLTETAVQDYQRANGLTADGVATPALQEKIFAAAQPAAASTATPDPTPTPAPIAAPTAAPSPAVVPVQQAKAYVTLNSRNSRLNVRQSASTSSAIRGTLPDGAEVTVTGVSGKWSEITANGLSGYVMSSYLTQAQPAAPEASTPAPQAETKPSANPTQAPSSSGYATLRHGDTGEAVKALQRKLKELGYFTGNIGGNYLSLTESAVKAFQKAKGLTADGVATPELQKMIFAASAGTSAPARNDEPSGGGDAAANATVNVGAGETLNLRASASASSTCLAQMKNGARVAVLATQGDWYKISYNGQTGYAYSDYIRKD